MRRKKRPNFKTSNVKGKIPTNTKETQGIIRDYYEKCMFK
jgi:hypothetical protein